MIYNVQYTDLLQQFVIDITASNQIEDTHKWVGQVITGSGIMV